jgi:RNA polymerase sigma-70 factor, ECF subfamily
VEPEQTGSAWDEPAQVAAAQRNPADFGPLYERYVHRIFQYCLYRTGSRHDADEMTAQTFMRALEYLPRYRWQGAPFAAWLYRIADSVIHKSKRRSRPVQALPDLPWIAAPDLGLEEQELRQDLLRELYGLPDVQQQVLVLRFAQGLTYDEMAQVVDRTPAALRQLVYRALQTLRERMNRR